MRYFTHRFCLKPSAYVVIFVMVLCTVAVAQKQTELDSLTTAYAKTKSDTSKILLLNSIAFQYHRQSKPDTVKYLAELALNMSTKANYAKGKGRSFCMIGLSSYSKGEYRDAMTNLNKALELAKQERDKAGEALATMTIGSVHYLQNRHAQALDFYQRAYILFEQLNDKRGMANALNNIGNVYINQANYPLALEYQQRALAIYEKLNFTLGIASANNNIGNILMSQGHYARALEYHLRTLELRERINDKLGMGASLNNIGVIQSELGNTKKSIEYHEQALSVRRRIGDKYGVATSLLNLGTNYANVDSAKAKAYLIECLKLGEQLGDKMDLAGAYEGLGNLADNQRNFKSAITYYEKAVEVEVGVGDNKRLPQTYCRLALVYMKLSNWTKADSVAELALRAAHKVNTLRSYAKVNETLYIIYKTQGLQDTALVYMEKYKQASDSLFSVEKSVQIANLESIAELKEKQKEIELLSKNEQLLRQENELQKSGRQILEKQQQVERLFALAQSETNKRKQDSLYLLAREAQVEAERLRMNEAKIKAETQANELMLNAAQQRTRLLQVIVALVLVMLMTAFVFAAFAYRSLRRLKRANAIVTEQKAEIEAMNENLEKLVAHRTEALLSRNKQLEQYAFFNAHSLRGPVATLLGLFQVLKTERDPEVREQLLGHVKDTAVKIDEVVHQLQGIVKDQE